MIVADTHAWVWWAAAPDRLSQAAREALETSDVVGVCTISAWEVAMLTVRRRIALDRDVRMWVRHALGQPRVRALPLTADIAVSAALLEGAFPGDPADRIIYATASMLGVTLLTRDAALQAFDPARTRW